MNQSLKWINCHKGFEHCSLPKIHEKTIYHLESTWRNSHVLVYHGTLLIHLLGVVPSTFTTVYSSFPPHWMLLFEPLRTCAFFRFARLSQPTDVDGQRETHRIKAFFLTWPFLGVISWDAKTPPSNSCNQWDVEDTKDVCQGLKLRNVLDCLKVRCVAYSWCIGFKDHVWYTVNLIAIQWNSWLYTVDRYDFNLSSPSDQILSSQLTILDEMKTHSQPTSNS